ncbi:hypothetical protein MtrunA17_Chr4g0071321 [Medicago truncatula]|uniref:Uncharacterized protein n=2 Tax=Medicago truncatula TaxID=3880 RepID=A0A072UT60_MEDTR|nr:hypothetical protein MTR_4g126400 [Medicago truncatula]RHN64647.1 hypothetical protein MtrunA17_Chr4g0071321 [Medicago truncatula]
MDWWHKLRRTLTVLSTRIKLRKSGAGGVAGCRGSDVVEFGDECGGGGGVGGGLMKLRGDVEMCGYRDVELMWNMLGLNLKPEAVETPRSTKPKLTRRSCKQRFNSKLFFWTNQ